MAWARLAGGPLPDGPTAPATASALPPGRPHGNRDANHQPHASRPYPPSPAQPRAVSSPTPPRTRSRQPQRDRPATHTVTNSLPPSPELARRSRSSHRGAPRRRGPPRAPVINSKPYDWGRNPLGPGAERERERGDRGRTARHRAAATDGNREGSEKWEEADAAAAQSGGRDRSATFVGSFFFFSSSSYSSSS